MSGICGVVAFDGRDLPASEIASMLDAMAVRGPDGLRMGGCPGALFGHALNATTPEGSAESMPFVDTESGQVLTGDIRLDNREDLAGALGLSARRVGDGAIVLRAYQRW